MTFNQIRGLENLTPNNPSLKKENKTGKPIPVQNEIGSTNQNCVQPKDPPCAASRTLVLHFRLLPLFLIELLQNSMLRKLVKNNEQHEMLRSETEAREELQLTWCDPTGFFQHLRNYVEGKEIVHWGIEDMHALVTPKGWQKPTGNMVRDHKNGHEVALVIAITDRRENMLPTGKETMHLSQIESGRSLKNMICLGPEELEIACKLLFGNGQITFKWINYWRREGGPSSSIMLSRPTVQKQAQCFLHKVMAKREMFGPEDLLSPEVQPPTE